MTGPEDPAAAGRGRIRAGHADREQVIEALKNAFVQGRLTRDELDTRAGRTLAARTRADPRRPGRADRRHPGRPGRGEARAPSAAGPGTPPAAGQGGRRVGRLPGHRVRRRMGRRQHPRSGWPRQSLSSLESPVPFGGLSRRDHGTGHHDPRDGHRRGAEALSQAAAAANRAAFTWLTGGGSGEACGDAWKAWIASAAKRREAATQVAGEVAAWPARCCVRPGDRPAHRLAPWELPQAFSHLALINACVHLIREDERIAAG